MVGHSEHMDKVSQDTGDIQDDNNLELHADDNQPWEVGHRVPGRILQQDQDDSHLVAADKLELVE